MAFHINLAVQCLFPKAVAFEKTTTTPLVPWLLEISGKGNTPEARKLVESNIIGLLGDLKEMVSVVAAKRGELGQPIKYRVLE